MAIRRTAAAALACAALLLAPAAGAQAPGASPPAKTDAAGEAPPIRPATPTNTWYAQAMAHGDAGLNVTHFWSKGPKMRAETVIAGHKVVTIVDGDTYYAYDAVARKGIAIRRTPDAIAADSPRRRPFGREYESLVKQGGERVGEQEFQGARVEIVRLTDGRGRREVWATKSGAKLPVKVIIYNRLSRKTQVTDYLNWLRNIPIEDSFFEPEPAVSLDHYDFDQYMKATAERIAVGPVPVLYGDLLHGNVIRGE